MKRRILALCLFAFAAVASAQTIRPRRPGPIIILPPCDVSKLLDLLDEFYAPAPVISPAPEYCAPRTCEAQAQAIKQTKEAKLLQSIDLMRLACRSYFPS